MAMEASPRDDSTPADAELSPERAARGCPAMEDREPLPEHELAADPDPDEPGAEGPEAEQGPPVEPHELRPQRKLRLWQLAPIVVLGALGSLMFAFPLAFEPGDSAGAVVAMLGLLLCGCSAGWSVMAARRVGHTWPGLPARGSGGRPDWRVVLLYAVVVCTVVVLAVWRVARLR
ncbi:hypothetical protein AN217_21950 [Streptomyces qinglanensis]|uniref:Transmembrane protein n=1 Tax=Streptomyces qinglanensis TaxID=943816 RepID=A0A1E7K7Y9_9ACTN|nr:hypothetical protein AN217_21950 [Streptomyces qinglanensis]OEV25222.1 hypothetical protein AN220_15080 [Streptomyces nanshensis]OEV25223.1 hypothetical protein AN220_15090 [Streptomyces nanshensis]